MDEFAVVASIRVSLEEDSATASDVESCIVTEEPSMTAAEPESTAVPDELRDGNDSVEESGALDIVDPASIVRVNGTDSDDGEAVGIESCVIGELISLEVKGNVLEIKMRFDALLGSVVGAKVVVLIVEGPEYPTPSLVLSAWLTHKRSVHCE